MRKLGDLEALVMEQLWASTEPLSVRQVLEALPTTGPDGRNRAYTTVMTVMDNLFHKSFVVRERSGRAYVYRASQTRAEHTAEVMEDALTHGGDRGAALMHFVDQLTPEEAAQLRALLGSREPS
ncbi:BlaI/MecI/CopY family transcriptional regulator [Nocardioides speluncae]|uniref:BlaI/MecI/CopY family transcriptional regulator n=1 Tax=Nocardioides speluncae TaxID=2670337 RepID=UPI000D68AC9F|nr:BlaI/MecI/CopY family transcriptional regulator [Nocardioides speluncae]